MELLSRRFKKCIEIAAVLADSKEPAVHVDDIASKVGISDSYVEQLVTNLRAVGIVQGIRGPGGGYTLTKSASEITLADIAGAVDSEEMIFKGMLKSVTLQEACI